MECEHGYNIYCAECAKTYGISIAVRHRRYCQGCEAYYPVSKPHEHGSEVCQLDADGTCGWIHPR